MRETPTGKQQRCADGTHWCKETRALHNGARSNPVSRFTAQDESPGSTHMAHVDDEIASQPACWRRAVELAPVFEMALPRRGHRVAVVGCGTSWFIAQCYATLRERTGHGETDAYAASEFRPGRHYDRIVAITRSGTTTEVLDLLRGLPAHTPTTVLTGVPDSPAARLATDPVPLPFADERSVVQTRFATSALAVLRSHLGDDLRAALAAVDEALAAPLPLVASDVSQVAFLARGWAVGLAYEAALKCREAATFWAEAYPAMEYRHGPIAIAAPGRAVWCLGEPPDGLAGEVAATGASFVHSGRDPMAELVLAQRFAIALAVHCGLDPDRPRHLSRSVVLS
jgi:fructoselysine-6-P-deglycase FrlB-like protein